ncbi:MAG: Flp pilus assembly protein CpaB [Bryobacteraceae bacterium]
MNRRLLGVFAFALLVAGATSFLVYRLLLAHVAAPVRTPAPNRLLVAAHDLQVGALIRDSDVREISWPGPVPSQAVTDRQQVVGRGVIEPVYQDEPFFAGSLAPKGAGAGLASTIPIGMRAVALRVDDVVGLAGFVLPGMVVDVLVSGNPPGADTGRTGSLCKTVLQDIEVLSAGQKIKKNMEDKPESAQVVNLLVTPDQAEILSLASNQTRVQLVLRNPLDTAQQKTDGASVAGLFGVPAAHAPQSVRVVRAPAKPAVQTATVEVFSGVNKTEQTFDIPIGSRR